MDLPLAGQKIRSLRRIRLKWVLSFMVLLVLVLFLLLYIGFYNQTQIQTQTHNLTQTQIQSRSQPQSYETMEKSPGFSDTIQRPRGDSYPKPRHAIQGFSYDGAVEGKQRIKITADSFGIHKKQLGFLRFGLLQEAVFINAKIHLYGIDLMDKGRADKGKGVNSMVDTYFSEIFSSDKLLFIPEKVSGVRMTPVKIYLHDNENKVVGFSAQNGEIRLKDKTILLAGVVFNIKLT